MRLKNLVIKRKNYRDNHNIFYYNKISTTSSANFLIFPSLYRLCFHGINRPNVLQERHLKLYGHFFFWVFFKNSLFSYKKNFTELLKVGKFLKVFTNTSDKLPSPGPSSTKLKILGTGEIKNKINIEANLASKSAVEKLEKIGGSIQLKK